MKLHHFLFGFMLIAGAWITNIKASHYEAQGRTPASVTTGSAMKDMAISAGK